MKKLYLSLAFLSAFTFQVSAQLQGLDVVKVPEAQQPYSGEYVYIPDVDGYKTLKCDFHTHTIFSDGDVKPENRVWEGAIRGLDVIAITDHIEYRPNKFITADHNESYRRAKTVEESSNLVVIPGAEITRSKPLGHINALFLKDANALDVEDPLVAISLCRRLISRVYPMRRMALFSSRKPMMAAKIRIVIRYLCLPMNSQIVSKLPMISPLILNAKIKLIT